MDEAHLYMTEQELAAKGLERLRLIVGMSAEKLLGEAGPIKCETTVEEAFKAHGGGEDLLCIRPQRPTLNVWGPGVLVVKRLRCGDTDILEGREIDGYFWNANGVGMHLDAPLLRRDQHIVFEAEYTGILPVNTSNQSIKELVDYWKGRKFLFTLGLIGPVLRKIPVDPSAATQAAP